MQPNREDRTLAYQIISFLFVVMLVVFMITILVTRAIYARVLLNDQLNNMSHMVHERVYLIDGRLYKIESLARNALSIINDYGLSDDLIQKYMRDLIQDNDEVQSIALASSPEYDIDCIIMFSVRQKYIQRELQTDDYQYQDWFQIPLLSGKPEWTEPWFDAEGKGRWIISYSLPIYEKGIIKGVLRFDTELQYLQEIIAGGSIFKIGNSFLVSTTGTLIAHANKDLVMNQTLFSLAQEFEDEDLKKLGYAMISGETGHQSISGNSPFRDSWIYYYPLQSNKWSVALAISDAEMMEDVNLILVIQTFASILIFLIMSIIIYLRATSVTKPLRALTIAADKMAAGDFDAVLPQSDHTFEISRLSQSFRAMQQSINEYIRNLQITTLEKDQIHGDVIYASEIQTNLIPKNSDHPLGIKDLRAHGILMPAGEIGGDLYDYFLIDDDHFGFLIADVTGKGIVAAMTMTMVSTLIPAIAPYHKQTSDLMKALNDFLYKNNIEANFVTAFLGIIELSTGILEFSNCGHVPFFVRNMDKSVTQYSETHSTALGVFANVKIGCQRIQLNVGDEIILITDGITEAMNSNEEFLCVAGLNEILKTLPLPNPENTAKTILEKVHAFAENASTRDDITILVIDYKHPGLISS